MKKIVALLVIAFVLMMSVTIAVSSYAPPGNVAVQTEQVMNEQNNIVAEITQSPPISIIETNLDLKTQNGFVRAMMVQRE